MAADLPPVIAVDGPAASGKGTVAAGVARALAFHYLDSGSLYRLVALKGQMVGTPLADAPALAGLAAGLDVRFEGGTVVLDGADVRYGADWVEASGRGRLRGGTIDCVAIHDAAMTLAITALFADAPTTLTNIGSWRVKETDRIVAMATELAKLGAVVENGDDWLRVTPPTAALPLRGAAIDTYDDHRMAMCFSLAALAGVPVAINDPDCVRKTFPGYFDAFARIVR